MIGTNVSKESSSLIEVEVARRAYEKWIARNESSNLELLDWLQAEADFASVSAFARQMGESKETLCHLLDERQSADRRTLAEHTITALLETAGSVREAASKLVQAIGECFEWDMGAVWILDREAEVLRCLEVWHSSHVDLPAFERDTWRRTYARGIGLPGRVWDSQTVIWLCDVTTETNFPRGPTATADGLHGAMGFPIHNGTLFLGVLEFFSREIRQPNEQAMEMMISIGRQVSQFVECRESARLATIGQMVTVLAHETRNALQRIQACLSMLLRATPDNDKTLDYVSRLQSALDDLRHMFDQIRSSAAPLHLDQLQSDIRQLICEAWTQVSSVPYGKQVGMTLEDTDLDLHCEVDPERMLQVYRNILENAVTACGDPVNISVSWSETDLDRASALQTRISDNGPGFSPEQRRKAFQPFFTTKPTGTGLGLVICKQIVERHGGQIEICDNSDHGAEILISLPRRMKR